MAKFKHQKHPTKCVADSRNSSAKIGLYYAQVVSRFPFVGASRLAGSPSLTHCPLAETVS
jgi:hypothetical protein